MRKNIIDYRNLILEYKEKVVRDWLFNKEIITNTNVSKNCIMAIYKLDLHGQSKKHKVCINYLYKNITNCNISVIGNKIVNVMDSGSNYRPMKQVGRHKQKYNKQYSGNDFYHSREWRELRVKALTKYGRKCCLCGRSVKDGVILHVDHIKPRSKRPDLELYLDNLQVLCEDCNLGKSNKYQENWR